MGMGERIFAGRTIPLRGDRMIVEYTGRQFVVTEKYKALAGAALERIGMLVGDHASAHVILTVDKYRKIAEVTVMNGGPNLVAVCESAEMTTALRDALAKVEQQVVRSRQRTTTIMRHPRVAGLRTAVEATDAGASLSQ
jgi:putative sigma-54 modulation protein